MYVHLHAEQAIFFLHMALEGLHVPVAELRRRGNGLGKSGCLCGSRVGHRENLPS